VGLNATALLCHSVTAVRVNVQRVTPCHTRRKLHRLMQQLFQKGCTMFNSLMPLDIGALKGGNLGPLRGVRCKSWVKPETRNPVSFVLVTVSHTGKALAFVQFVEFF
jgi:hypothetical protein